MGNKKSCEINLKTWNRRLKHTNYKLIKGATEVVDSLDYSEDEMEMTHEA